MTQEPTSSDKLAAALTEAGAPAEMIERARAGYYSDFGSELPLPCVQLVADLHALGLTELMTRAKDGEFDATQFEVDAWAASPDGQATFAELTGQTPEQIADEVTAIFEQEKQARENQMQDAVVACANLVGRAGAREFQIGYLRDDPANPGWYAHAQYRGARITSADHAHPVAAAMGLATRILTGARCKCGRLVSLSPLGATIPASGVMADGSPGWTVEQATAAGQCLWRLVGQRWDSGCEVEGPPKMPPRKGKGKGKRR